MQHIAMIMDGNRRWAREKKLEAVMMGHRKGIESIKTAVRFCLKNKIKYLSLYTFSLENLKRKEIEKNYLFNLFNQSKKELTNLVNEGVRVRFIGDKSLFPGVILSTIDEVEAATQKCDKMNLNFLFCYGSQQEMVDAAKKVATKVGKGELSVDDITLDSFRNEMWLGNIPEPEMIIRTGKVARLSNFLLFQAAYSELMFLDCYWPEISESKLQECMDRFYEAKRNFGN